MLCALSLAGVGRPSLHFLPVGCAFLLESGFLALFLLGGSPLTLSLFRLLLFRFMFMGGVVKLTSGDPTWRQLTTLDYHFETQGLMTVKLGWLTRPISNPAS